MITEKHYNAIRKISHFSGFKFHLEEAAKILSNEFPEDISLQKALIKANGELEQLREVLALKLEANKELSSVIEQQKLTILDLMNQVKELDELKQQIKVLKEDKRELNRKIKSFKANAIETRLEDNPRLMAALNDKVIDSLGSRYNIEQE